MEEKRLFSVDRPAYGINLENEFERAFLKIKLTVRSQTHRDQAGKHRDKAKFRSVGLDGNAC